MPIRPLLFGSGVFTPEEIAVITTAFEDTMSALGDGIGLGGTLAVAGDVSEDPCIILCRPRTGGGTAISAVGSSSATTTAA